jgi:hypothetical protein
MSWVKTLKHEFAGADTPKSKREMNRNYGRDQPELLAQLNTGYQAEER